MLGILSVFVLTIFASIMFAGADYSLGPISRDSIEKMVENDVAGAKNLLRLTGGRRRFQLMLLTGRICSIIVGTIVLSFLFEHVFNKLITGRFACELSTFIASLLVFMFTDGVLSRLVATSDHETSVSRFGSFLYFSALFLYPLSILFDGMAGLIIKPNVELAAKEEALREYVKSESELGVIEEEEGEMIQSILAFADTSAREVMVPRIDVVAADITTSIDELISLFKTAGHSRIPLYDGRIDNIAGVLYAKDLLIEIAEKGRDGVSAITIMRKPYFVPETKKISELLNDLRQAKVHLAIVVDEYGGTSGIVALEDLIEEIVGEIQDEYDSEEREYVWVDSNTLILDAGLNIEEVNDLLRTDIPNEDFDTLGGFLYHRLGFIPEGGEEITWGEAQFTVKEIIGHRISKVLVKLHEHEDGEDEEQNK